MLIDRRRSALLVVDAQEKLLPHIHEGQRISERCGKLIKGAKELGVPLLLTEHYPQGLGKTVAALRDLVPESTIAKKVYFSAVKEGSLAGLAGYEKPQVIVCGAEAHVCVMQTALDLRSAGKEVFIVADAVGSRTAENRDLALQRFARNHVEIVSTEMVLFEWLERAGTQSFRTLLRTLIR